MAVATILFGVGCAATLWLARTNERRFVLALGLAYVWMVANLAYHVDALLVAAGMDVLLALAAMGVGRSAVADEVIVLSLARVSLHFAYAMGLSFGVFAVAYNIAFAAQLAAVAAPGGIIDGVRDCLRVFRSRGGGDRGGTFRAMAEA